MINYLRYYNLNIMVVATKSDKVTKNSREKNDKLVKSALKIDNFIRFSSVTKKGLEEVYDIIESYI